MMNRQEIFDGNIVNSETALGTYNPALVKLIRRGFSDVTCPRFFSGWPYFIVILAALLMGSANLDDDTARSSFGNRGEYPKLNQYEVNPVEFASALTPHPQKLWCSSEINTVNNFLK